MQLTVAAVLALAASCQSAVSPATIAKIAWVESSFDPARTHVNRDHSTDVGLMQINSKNFGWLGLTEADALDPCKSIKAGAEVLTAYSRYNTGSPIRGITNGYAEAVAGAKVAVVPSTPLALPRSSPFSKPARTGRDLVFATPRTGLDNQ